jgi:hypothetical protein
MEGIQKHELKQASHWISDSDGMLDRFGLLLAGKYPRSAT